MHKRVLILLAFCYVAQAGPSSSETLEPFRNCLFELRQASARYHRWLPMPVFTMDRRLLWMDNGIGYLEQNLTSLEAHVAIESSSTESHVFSNAIEGCHLFQSQYEARAHRFLALMACLVALVATLTLRLISFTLPGSKRKKPDARKNPPHVSTPPSDRPNAAIR